MSLLGFVFETLLFFFFFFFPQNYVVVWLVVNVEKNKRFTHVRYFQNLNWCYWYLSHVLPSDKHIQDTVWSPEGKKKRVLYEGGMKRLHYLVRSVSKQEKHFMLLPSETNEKNLSGTAGTSEIINHLSDMLINT